METPKWAGKECRMSQLVVVGVDGSAEAAHALEYAATDAARRGATLQVVSVIPMPEYWMVPLGFAPPRVPVPSWELAPAAREAAQDAVDVLSDTRPELVRQVEIEVVGACARPTVELVERSRDADLLVLGHRGRGPVASVFLGSVGLHCVLQAHCPVTIVRSAPHKMPSERAVPTAEPSAV